MDTVGTETTVVGFTRRASMTVNATEIEKGIGIGIEKGIETEIETETEIASIDFLLRLTI